jgi:hypothetical protein
MLFDVLHRLLDEDVIDRWGLRACLTHNPRPTSKLRCHQKRSTYSPSELVTLFKYPKVLPIVSHI